MHAGQPQFALRPDDLQQAGNLGQRRRHARKTQSDLLHAVPERLQRTTHTQDAPVQHRDVIRHPLHVGQLVRGEENRPVRPARQVDHGFDQRPVRHRIQPQRRVVQHQQFRFGGQRQPETDPRPLAARQVLHPRRGLEIEMADDAAENFFIPTRIKLRLKFAALRDAHPAVKLMFLGQVADARPGFRRQGADVVAQNAAARRGSVESSPSNMRMVVVLPEPFRPRTQTHIPRGTSRFRSCTAGLAPKYRVKPRVQMTDFSFIASIASFRAFPLAQLLFKRLPQFRHG